MKILEVLLTEAPIYQDTKWEKKGIDLDSLPSAILRRNFTPNTTTTLADLTAKLNAWKTANPKGKPEQAWIYLGGKGPAPEETVEMPARDLRIEPPDDSGDWIEFGDKWQNTKVTPVMFAIKPNPTKPNTWGPNWIPAAEAIRQIRKETKNISDDEVTKKLKALTDSKGQRKYSDKEVKDAWSTVKHHEELDKLEEPDSTEEEPKPPKRIFNPKTKKWECPTGWSWDKKAKACVRDETAPEPTVDDDDNVTCPTGWKYDADNGVCVRAGNTPSPVENKPENKIPTPVVGKDGKKTCEAPFVYDPATDSCVNTSAPPAPAPVTPAGTPTIIFPAGNKDLINKKNPFGSKGGKHRGIDILVPYGTKLVAPESGEIIKRKTETGTDAKTGKKFRGGAGLYMVLKSSDGTRIHKFMHLSQSSPAGTSLSQGEEMAYSGGAPMEVKDDTGKVILSKEDDMRPGNADGIHLHWEVWVNGVPTDPASLVKK